MGKTVTKQMLAKINESISNVTNLQPQIEELAKVIADKIQDDGRIIFVGAGLSSEMAKIIIDELWFNFQINKNKFLALTAARNYLQDTDSWKELEEVSSTSIFELDELGLNSNDLVIGISSSGKTQYVVSAIKYAHDIGCITAAITDVSKSVISENTDYSINTEFGNPPIIGLNAAEGGTLQKIILDLLFYNAMVFAGRIYNNSLVFMKPVSAKIEAYCVETISTLLKLDRDKARELFEENNKNLEITLIRGIKGITSEEAHEQLIANKFNFNKILN